MSKFLFLLTLAITLAIAYAQPQTGSAGPGTRQARSPELPPASTLVTTDVELQAQIQNALNKEPTLSGDIVIVKVSEEKVEIAGTVATWQEKLTATRIVESYAGNRKLVSRLNVTGRGRKPSPAPPPSSHTGGGPGKDSGPGETTGSLP